MKNKKQIITELVFNLFIVAFVIFGQITAVTQRSFMNAVGSPLLYYTNQSNVWIGVICAVFVLFDLILLIKNEYIEKPNWLYILKFIFTIAITLTGLVFNFVLYPQSIITNTPFPYFSPNNFTVHVIVPILSIASFIIFDYKFKTSKLTFLYPLLTPIYYFCFVMIMAANNVYFTTDSNFPYFFLDYKTLGWFSFDNGIGVVYWIIIVMVIVALLSLLFIFIKNKRAKSIEKKAV